MEANPLGIEPLLDADDVTEALRLPSRRAAYRLFDSGALPVVRLGRKLRVRPSDLRAYIAAQTVPARIASAEVEGPTLASSVVRDLMAALEKADWTARELAVSERTVRDPSTSEPSRS